MIEVEATIVNQEGMHMRPSMKVVDIANKYQSSITMKKGHLEVNAKSIMEIVTLTACKGELLVIKANGVDEEQAVNEIKNTIDDGFSEVY